MSEIKLSILIPSTHDRKEMLDGLLSFLKKQITDLKAHDEVEVLTEIDGREISVGNKRQILLERAKGDMILFIDSDDEISSEYLFEILNAMSSEPDVITFDGYMSTNGQKEEKFKIAQGLPYITIPSANGLNEYLRFPNHLTATRRSIALQIGFKDLRFAEDYDYSFRLKDSGLIKTSVHIQKELYHYKYITNKI